MNDIARADQTASNEVLYQLDEGFAVITLNAPCRRGIKAFMERERKFRGTLNSGNPLFRKV